jgi:iron(III) transport system permease protein
MTGPVAVNRRADRSGLGAIAMIGLALLTALPILSVGVLALAPGGSGASVLGPLPVTIVLVAGVGIASSAVGLGAAWLVTRYRFFGRDVLSFALVLPLSVPTYLAAYSFLEAMDYSGPLQGAIRAAFGFERPGDYWFPELRSLPGAIFVLTSVLYPYVYLSCRLMLERQGGATIESARVLGAGGWQVLLRIAAPLTRPAIAAGATLAMLETMNDLGAVEALGVRSLAFSVYDTWLNRSDLAGAARIAMLALFAVAVLMWFERAARGDRGYAARNAVAPALAPLPGAAGAAAFLACLFPVAAGFGLPLYVLGGAALRRLPEALDAELFTAALNTLAVATGSAIAATAAALLLAAGMASAPGMTERFAGRAALLGYAVPGPVLAVGTLYAFTSFDNALDGWLRAAFGLSSGLLLSGSAAIVVYACTVRFLAPAHGAIETGQSQLARHASMAARTLGRSRRRAFAEVELPLLNRALATAGLLVFVDAAKELPATLILRPFGFGTLATHVYEKASQARFGDGAAAALAIVAIGAVPLLVLLRTGKSGGKRK